MKLFNKLFAVVLMFCSTISFANQENEVSVNSDSNAESKRATLTFTNSPNCEIMFDRTTAYINKNGGDIANYAWAIAGPTLYAGSMRCERAGDRNPFIHYGLAISISARGFGIPGGAPPDQYFCTYAAHTHSGPEFCTASIDVACPVGSTWDNEAKICRQDCAAGDATWVHDSGSYVGKPYIAGSCSISHKFTCKEAGYSAGFTGSLTRTLNWDYNVYPNGNWDLNNVVDKNTCKPLNLIEKCQNRNNKNSPKANCQ